MPRSGHAQPNPEADAAISKGIELRRQGKDEEALAQFQRAFKVAPSPRAKAQMGLAEQAIGRWADAERDLDEAMAQATDPWIIKQKGVLTEAMTVIRRHLGSLIVKGDPAGAVVELDGEPVGTLPMPERRVTAGEVVVTVRSRGYLTLTRKLTVTPGELAAEVFRLKRIESESAAGAVGGTAGGEGSGPAVVAPPVLPPPGGVTGGTGTPAADLTTNTTHDRQRAAAWATAAAGGVSLITGATFLLLGESTFRKFDDHCYIDDNTGQPAGGDDCANLNDTVHRDRVIGGISLAVGGALAVTSGVLFYLSRSSDATSGGGAHALGCAPAGVAGVRCAWRF